MKQLPHIASRLFNEPAVITPARHAAICQIVEARLAQPTAALPDKMPGAEHEPDNEDDLPAMAETVIIPVHGTLVAHPEDIGASECGCSMESLCAAIDAAEASPQVKTVIYDFRTPGGGITAIPETGRKIRYSRKNTVAFTGSECCSGGLWLAAQCRRFYATQSSRVGSVGVYTLCLDYSEAMKQRGVKINAIFAGKYKLLGAYWEELTDDKKAIIQARVDKIYGQFKEAMETYRIVQDDNFGNGLVFDGEEAVELGFTDGVVESINDILDGMVE